MSVCRSVCLSVFLLSVCLCIILPFIFLFVCMLTCRSLPSVRPSVCLSVCISVFQSACFLSVYLSFCPSVVCLGIIFFLSVCLYANLSVPSVRLSICLSVCLSFCPSVCLSVIPRGRYSYLTWTHLSGLGGRTLLLAWTKSGAQKKNTPRNLCLLTPQVNFIFFGFWCLECPKKVLDI